MGAGEEVSHCMQTEADVAATTAALARTLAERLQQFLRPLLLDLDAQLDKRLVRTFAATVQGIIQLRNRASGLLLSELGGVLLSPAHAPAGTKRLSRLLLCYKWGSEIIADFLWSLAAQRKAELEGAGEDVLALWDESVLEKPESVEGHGLGSVRSSKAARLKRIKPGFYTPPGGPPRLRPGVELAGRASSGQIGVSSARLHALVDQAWSPSLRSQNGGGTATSPVRPCLGQGRHPYLRPRLRGWALAASPGWHLPLRPHRHAGPLHHALAEALRPPHA